MDKDDTNDFDEEFGGKKKKKQPEWVNLDREKYPDLYNSFDSIYPSYTNLAVAYPVIVRQRYHLMRILYAQQLQKELCHMERLHQRALRGVRTHRVFSEGFHCTQADIRPPLKRSERRRLETLMAPKRGFDTVDEDPLSV